MRTRFLLAGLLAATAACSKSEPADAVGPPPGDAKGAEKTESAPTPVDPATVASVAGAVRFDGTPPKRERLLMSADPVCHGAHPEAVFSEDVVVNPNGTLRNVFVHVKSGLEGLTFPAPLEPVLLDQRGCRYIPHVLGVQVGQTWRVKTSDATLHNIHTLSAKNTPINLAMPGNAPEMNRSFKTPELGMRVKCDVHPWMSAVIHVVKHPCFAVTGDDGAFAIGGLPPGEYVLEAIHETLGTKTATVKLEAREKKSVDFTFP